MTPENSPEKTMEHSKERFPSCQDEEVAISGIRNILNIYFSELQTLRVILSDQQNELQSLRQQANHPTLTQICEENQSLRKRLAETEKRIQFDDLAFKELLAELAKNKAAREWVEKLSSRYNYDELTSRLSPDLFIELRALIQPEEKK
jgi:hypothetical protein